MTIGLSTKCIGQQLATEAKSDEFLSGGDSIAQILLLQGKPGMFFLFVGPHGAAETDEKVKTIQRRRRLALTDQAGGSRVSLCMGPFDQGSRAVEGIVLEKENAHREKRNKED
jgi:hypothetical protein